MAQRMRTVSVALFMAALVGLAACGDEEGPSAGGGTTTPSPSPSQSTFEEAEWTITVPAGWTKEDITSSADAKKAVRYKAASGEYFIVAIDPTGSDFSSDATWRYEVKGSSFEIVEKADCTGGPDQQCSTTDARYDGYILWKGQDTPPKVGGHTWYFVFGDTNTTTVEPTAFEQIAESIVVKS